LAKPDVATYLQDLSQKDEIDKNVMGAKFNSLGSEQRR